jgi:hypothetical protein
LRGAQVSSSFEVSVPVGVSVRVSLIMFPNS